ncbi:hypothetical protein V3N99_11295 [Dermatophilaceae bacterium Soc4.6]
MPLTPAERGALDDDDPTPRATRVVPADGAGWTPGPTESLAVPAPVTGPVPGPATGPLGAGVLDDPAAYGRWRLQGDPELAQWREEPEPSEAPIRRTFGAVDDEGPSPSRIAVRVLAGLVAATVVVLVGLAVLVFGVLRKPGDTAPAASASRPSTAAVATPPPGAGAASATPGTATTSAKPTATSSPTTTAYPPVSLAGSPCGASGTGAWSRTAAGTSQTSCPFALAVQRAFVAGSPRPGQPRTVSATSPVTGKAYPMACTGDQPVTCTGGNGAVVYLYGGAATFR